MDNKQVIREVIEKWMTATKRGDARTVLSLMTDDVIFMVHGQGPFRKEVFEKASKEMKDVKIDGKSEIKEIRILP